MLTEEELVREAAAARFQNDPLEKVLRLVEMLESLRSQPRGVLVGRESRVDEADLRV